MAMRRVRGPADPVYLDTQPDDVPVPVSLDAGSISEIQQVSEVLGNVSAAAAQPNTLVAQPAAGMRLAITGILVSTDTAGAITLTAAGATVGGPIYLPANGSGNPVWVDPLRLGLNHGLRFTSTIAGNHSVTAYGWEE